MIHCRSRMLAAALVLLAGGTAHAQQDVRIGAFHLRLQTDPITDEDRGFAVVFPTGMREGALTWACGGDRVGLLAGMRLGRPNGDEPIKHVVWRFDRERPDTTFLEGADEGETWFVRPRDLVSFTVRAKAASRLVIRVIDEAPSTRQTDYLYDLTGSNAALNRLSCARDPRVPAAAGERQVPPRAERRDRRARDLSDTYELTAVEKLPRLQNVAEFQAALRRGYPVSLRDAGVSGMVEVRFRVLSTGQVDGRTITVIRSSHHDFNAPAIQAVHGMVFEPARVNGRPVNVWVVQPIQFGIGGRSGPSAAPLIP